MATIAALVPAAGCGARAGLKGNKILAPLCGKPLLYWTLSALANAAPLLAKFQLNLSHIFVAARSEEFELIEPIARKVAGLEVTLVEGGDSRQQSVWNAAKATHAAAEYVLVHDAARPLVSPDLILRVCQAVRVHGAAIAAVPASDTVKIVRESGDAPFIGQTLDRKIVYLAQTPQVFRREIFLKSFERAANDQFNGTDCASVLEHSGHPVAIVEGLAGNIKVTYAPDLERAEILMQTENPLRV
jgi:2-C-methyl-D-erythritol 4-phosphate cytidylyltransferase